MPIQMMEKIKKRKDRKCDSREMLYRLSLAIRLILFRRSFRKKLRILVFNAFFNILRTE